MSITIKSVIVALVTTTAMLLIAPSAQADEVMGNIISVEVNDDITVSVGGGVRADANFDITNDTNNFAVDNARLVFGVDTTYGVSADISAQYDGTATNNLAILDAVVTIDIPVGFVNEVKAGRMLPPQNRAGLAGDYGQIAWTFPSVISKYPSVNGYGRLDGAAIYGGASDVAKIPVDTKGALGDTISVDYSLGVFQGVQTNNVLVAGRFGVDVGGLDLGFVFQTQKEADLTGTSDFLGWNIDAAYNKAIGPGTVTVDGGFFKYDLDGAAYVPGAGLNEGLGGYVVGAYALDDFAIKAGKLTVTPQPFVRYQNFQFKGANDGEQVRWDAGANLILNEATNTKLTVNYFNDELQGVTNEGVLVGIQFAF